jgi:hypothetical protein
MAPLVTVSKAGKDFDLALYVDIILNDFRDMTNYIHYSARRMGVPQTDSLVKAIETNRSCLTVAAKRG